MTVTWTYNVPSGDSKVVEVAFTDGTVTHNRSVNAVFTDNTYDADATEVRVSEVGRGVETKIAVGAIADQESEDPAAP